MAKPKLLGMKTKPVNKYEQKQNPFKGRKKQWKNSSK